MTDNNEQARDLIAKALVREYPGYNWQQAQREAERILPWGTRK